MHQISFRKIKYLQLPKLVSVYIYIWHDQDINVKITTFICYHWVTLEMTPITYDAWQRGTIR